jgi:hypothetical protein
MLSVPCLDCGHPFLYRVDIEADPAGAPRVVVDERDFRDRFTRHVLLNPERHPTFVTSVPD